MFTTTIINITAATSTPQAAGIFDWVNEKTAATQTAIQGVLIVVGLIVGLIIAWRGKSVGGVIMGVLVGGLICALPVLITFFSGAASSEVVPADAGQMIDYARTALTTRV